MDRKRGSLPHHKGVDAISRRMNQRKKIREKRFVSSPKIPGTGHSPNTTASSGPVSTLVIPFRRRYANTKFAGPAGASGGPCTARPVLSTLMSPALIPLSCAASPAAAVRRGRGSPCHSNSAQLSSTQTPEPHLPPPSSERSPHASPPSPPPAAHLRVRPSMSPVE